MRKTWFACSSMWLVALVSLITGGACSSDDGKQIVKIAVLGPMTGDLASYGASTKEGALLAIKEWNAAGAVSGMQIEATVEDSRCDPTTAKTVAQKVIVTDKIHYIVGEICSGASIEVAALAEQHGAIEVTPISTNEKVTLNADGSVKEYVFRACFIDSFQGKVASKFALENLSMRKAFILANDGDAYSNGLAGAFKTAFTAGGGTIVGEEKYTAGQTDFTAIMGKIEAAAPQIIFLPDLHTVVNQVTRLAKQRNLGIPFLGGDGWDSQDLDMTSADGSYFTNHFSLDDTRPVVSAFKAKYKAEYGKDLPDGIVPLAYDATNLILAAIEKVGKDDPGKVKDELEKLTLDGVTGTISFDASHNPVKSAVVLQVKDGKVQYKATVEP